MVALLWLLGQAASAGIPASATATPEGARPVWPLKLATRYLTSNFMEFRPGRYHAGLDLKTDSQVGFPVLAAEAGSVVRVRAGAGAYGRAVYLLTAQGTTYVYGHLARFNDTIGDRVAQAQRRSGTYRAELEFKPGQIPVTAGQVLGLSGQSGTAGPHLHFEVRDAAQRPLNPLDHGFAVADSLPPVIQAVRAVPAEPDALVGGSRTPVVAEAGPRGLSGSLAPLAIRGPVAFSAAIVDHADLKGHTLEPYLIEATLDGRLVYSARNEGFAFADNALQHLEWVQTGSVRERWLHRREPVDLPGRSGDSWYLGPRGQGLSPGRHLLVITAADQAGNRTAVTLTLDALRSVSVGDSAAAPGGTGGTGPWLPEPRGEGVTIYKDSGDCRLTPFFAEGCEDSTLLVRRLSSARGDPVLAETVLWIRPWVPDPAALAQAQKQGLRRTGPAAEFLAADWPLEAAVAVDFPYPPAQLPDEVSTPAKVYRWHRQQWRPAGDLLAVADRSGRPRFALDRPGRYAVMRDGTAPRILDPASSEGQRHETKVGGEVLAVGPGPVSRVPGVTLPRWEVVPLDLQEEGSGVAAESIRVLLDGEPLVVEPDLPRSRLLIELPDDLPPGRHRLAVTLSDQAGNQGQGALDILCRE